MKTTTTTTATVATLNLSYSEEVLADLLRDAGFTEDEVYCTICEDREHREKARIENAMSDWSSNHY